MICGQMFELAIDPNLNSYDIDVVDYIGDFLNL